MGSQIAQFKMNGIILVLVITQFWALGNAQFGAIPKQDINHCTEEDGIVPLNWDKTCTRYFECSSDGLWSVRTCPTGMVIDLVMRRCAHPDSAVGWVSAECRENARLEGEALQGTQQDQSSFIDEKDATVSGETPCQGNNHNAVAHEDCSKYMQCVNKVWHIRECNPGTVFDVRELRCAHRHLAWGCGLQAEKDYKKQIQEWTEQIKTEEKVQEEKPRGLTVFANFGSTQEGALDDNAKQDSLDTTYPFENSEDFIDDFSEEEKAYDPSEIRELGAAYRVQDQVLPAPSPRQPAPFGKDVVHQSLNVEEHLESLNKDLASDSADEQVVPYEVQEQALPELSSRQPTAFINFPGVGSAGQLKNGDQQAHIEQLGSNRPDEKLVVAPAEQTLPDPSLRQPTAFTNPFRADTEHQFKNVEGPSTSLIEHLARNPAEEKVEENPVQEQTLSASFIEHMTQKLKRLNIFAAEEKVREDEVQEQTLSAKSGRQLAAFTNLPGTGSTDQFENGDQVGNQASIVQLSSDATEEKLQAHSAPVENTQPIQATGFTNPFKVDSIYQFKNVHQAAYPSPVQQLTPRSQKTTTTLSSTITPSTTTFTTASTITTSTTPVTATTPTATKAQTGYGHVLGTPSEGTPCSLSTVLYPVTGNCGVYLECGPDWNNPSLDYSLLVRPCAANTFFEPSTSKCDFKDQLKRTDC